MDHKRCDRIIPCLCEGIAALEGRVVCVVLVDKVCVSPGEKIESDS